MNMLPTKDEEWLGKGEGARPEIGIGATDGGYGRDRYPYTVMLVSDDGKTIYVAIDRSVRTDLNGVSESQRYDFFPSARFAAPMDWSEYTLRKNGRWVRTGQDQNSGRALTLGYRDRWHNYSL